MFDFLFPKRLRRLSYFLRAFPLNLFVVAATARLDQATPFTSGDILFCAGAFLLGIYGVVFVYLPRIRDCELPAWTLILAFIPYVSSFFGILLLFKDSRPAFLREHTDGVIPAATVAGSACSACGQSLLLASDGIVTASNQVLCHACKAKGELPVG